EGFKESNDTHGHSTGDELLQKVSTRLLGCVRGVDRIARQTEQDSEFVSRLGGDEFTILLDSLSEFSEAAIVAQRVIDGLAAPFHLEECEVYVSASIGIALYSDNLTSLDELLRNADLAMYHAKKLGRNNFQFFDPAMNESVVERTTLAHTLRLAVERKELELHYQPILAAATREIVGVECLARWHSRECGLVEPERFITAAEQSGLIVDLGEWVLLEACSQFARWQEEGIAPERIGINISGQQFRTKQLVSAVIDAVRETKIDPGCVELEITETAVMVNEVEASECLEDLKRFGVSVALDDFGTGYSSLSYIRRFPVDALKIDRSFVDVIESNPEAHAITMAILAMAKRLGLRVVAEGVETESQGALLTREGCDELQGFLYSPPISASQMTALLRRDPAQPSA
ncbi:MAG: EAL domain-containing protein, partial [bacterium]|nr:EAL domain-containing protein [bacterium]